MEVMVGQGPGNMGCIPRSFLNFFFLCFWNVLGYTTPSTSKLWSCLSFLGVPAMQIRAGELQIPICGGQRMDF